MKPEKLSDPDMQTATAALIRASQRARKLAEQTKTEYVFMRDGKLIREIPQPAQEKQDTNHSTDS